jgi:prepilin-type processing-associated H-X9-DG protein
MSQPPTYEPQTPMPKRETSGTAIASLICGILSWVCVGLLAAIPAVITGHMALGKIKRSAGALAGRGMAIAGLILGYASIVALIVLLVLFFALVGPALKEIASKSACMAHLHRIGTACNAYAAEHNGRYPERLSELYPEYVPNLKVFVCPSTHVKITSPDEIDSKTSYEYYGAALNASTAAKPLGRAILACDKDGHHRHGKNILYADGHVSSEGMGGGSCRHRVAWDWD